MGQPFVALFGLHVEIAGPASCQEGFGFWVTVKGLRFRVLGLGFRVKNFDNACS